MATHLLKSHPIFHLVLQQRRMDGQVVVVVVVSVLTEKVVRGDKVDCPFLTADMLFLEAVTEEEEDKQMAALMYLAEVADGMVVMGPTTALTAKREIPIRQIQSSTNPQIPGAEMAR